MSAPTEDAVAMLTALADGLERTPASVYEVQHTPVVGRALADALRAVLARLAECEADAARLDWLEERGVSLVGVSVPLADTGDYAEVWEVRQQVMRGKDELLGWDTDIRLAIDAAREGAGHGEA